MVWYNEPMTEAVTGLNGYCYCELLLLADDLMLQGFLGYTLDSSWTFSAIAYQPDGTTLIADITSSFDYFFATDGSGNPYFAAKLLDFPTLLCGNCFILHVTISKGDTRAFDQWTDIYCIGSCCQIVTGTTITDQSGKTIPYSSDPLPIASPEVTEKCSKQIVRLEGLYDCDDNFGGNFYGNPGKVTGGKSSTGFSFRKITNIQATFHRGKREISKEVSLNCRTQKVTSVKTFDLQSFELFPEWKVEELEDLLCAPYIKIDDEVYLFGGGDDPFVIVNPKSCNYLYKFRATFRDCAIWQMFGCDDNCGKDNVKYFGFLSQASTYFDENARKIGNTFDLLKGYFQSQNGTYSVVEINAPVGSGAGQVHNPYYKILEVKSKAIIPAYVYTNNIGISSKVYGMELSETAPDYNSLFNASDCKMPVLGTIVFTDQVCQTPSIGFINYSNSAYYTGRVNSYESFIVSDTGNTVERIDNQVTLNFTVTNNTMSNTPEDPAVLSGQIIGWVEEEFAPSQLRSVVYEMNNSIPNNGAALTIDTSGAIRYYGPMDSGSDIATKRFIDIKYLL